MTTGADEERHWSVDLVEKWLSSTGFPLEARTAQALQRAGCEVEQSRYYVDHNQPGTLREMDVLATFRQHGPVWSGASSWHIDVRVVVECKESPNNPWVLFTAGKRWYRDHDQLATVEAFESNGGTRDRLSAMLESPLLLYRDGPYAYRLDTAAGKETSANTSLAYDAVQQVMSCVQGVMNDIRYDIQQGREAGEPSVSLFVPVIVTTAPLVQCSVGTDGRFQLEPVPMGLLVSRLRLDSELLSVWIVNDQGLEAFADMVRETAGRIALDIR